MTLPRSSAEPVSPEGANGGFVARLGRAGCTARARLSRYDNARFNQLTNQATVALETVPGEVPLLGSFWRVTTRTQDVVGHADALDFSVEFVCERGELTQASVSVDLEFAPWTAENYVLLPAAAYNGNRFPARRLRYSPKLYEVQDIGPDKPMVISDVPRLDDSGGVSRIQERSGSMATPAVGFHAPGAQAGCWLTCLHANALGDFGLSLEETRSRDRATIAITSPVVRELYNYRICDMRFPSIDTPHDFRAGDAVVIAFRLHLFAAPRLQDLFDRFVQIRKEHTAPGAPLHPLPYSACFEVQEKKFNTLNFVPEHGYYSVGFRENFLQDWQIGWTGGMISTYPLLFAGSEDTRRNVLRNFDWLFPNGLCPAGFFWDAGRHGTEWLGGDIRKPHTGNWHLIRKSGDGVYYIIKQLRLMQGLGLPVKPVWRDGTQRVCDSFVRLWRKWGQFGQFVDSLSGDVVVGGSTSGAIVPAALVLAADYFGQDEYRAVAREAAEHYYERFTARGLSCGGPGDALQNNDSESWYALIESYALLHASTGDRKWLDRAGEQARQFATWVVTYDYPFPPASLFGRAGIRSTGAVYANTQNKHAAPGICTYSGVALLRLFRATGDRFYLELLHDIAHHLPQYLPHPLKPLGGLPVGRMCERVNLTDWEGPDRIGEVATPTNWAETALMLTTVEIPGLYVQPQNSLVFAFDSITAKVVSESVEDIVVDLKNPTPAAGRIRIFSERDEAAEKPLPENYLLGCPVTELKAGENKRMVFRK